MINKIEIKGNEKGQTAFSSGVSLFIDGTRINACQEATLHIGLNEWNTMTIKTVGELDDISIEGVVFFVIDGKRWRVIADENPV